MTAWTKERPTEPGWYWVREDEQPDDLLLIIVVRAPEGHLKAWYADDGGRGCVDAIYRGLVARIDGEWQRAEPKP